MPNQISKTLTYDDAAYNVRWSVTLAASVAGASGTFGRYYARGNEQLYAAGAFQQTAGAATIVSTATTMVNGTTTTTLNTNTAATVIQPYRVSGTNTTTFQTFVVANANGVTGANALNNWTAVTNPGTYGGVALVAGDLIYMVNGADATAVSVPVYEFGYTPFDILAA